MRKKIYKTLIASVALIFILFTGVGLLIFLLIFSKRKARPKKSAETMLILGTQVKTSHGTTLPSQTLKERLDTGFTYLQQHPSTTVIVSGGQGADESASEAAVMSRYLQQRGLAKERIIEEDQATTTKENLQFSHQLRSLTDAVLVTSDFHMYRSLLIANHQGLHLQGLSAATENSSKYYSYLRETLALAFTLLKIYL
ncbi:YdcF family protein [Enterococcus sp. HY326]|uniref:YdcF family protein n=1 Tax=Enterococcus sp. HY326 TaxID=2971265 RepID=UPI00223F5F72|nr:YdcF family protein [Enterococcus sp. HY326]